MGAPRESEHCMTTRIERFAPILAALVALLTGGAWLASHGGPPQFPQYPGGQPQYPTQPQPPQYPQYPPPQPPPEPPPKQSSCADCADCASACDGCDVGDCDLSGCSDCDCSGVDCSGVDCSLLHARSSSGLLVLLLPLALLDAWRRGLLRRARSSY
jgi:hypothetical protein